MGEWAGTWIAIIGFFLSVLTNLFDDEMFSLNRAFSFMQLGDGFVSILLYPIYGFLLIISTRFLAEQIRAVSVIANGVRSIKKKLK
ncbi:MAG: hypothetical protein ACKO6Q_02980 [Bacteroidota bacterium]